MIQKSQCWTCKHFLYPEGRGIAPLNCRAFPDGIPRDIYSNIVMHDQPYAVADDHGLQWEERPEEDDTGRQYDLIRVEDIVGKTSQGDK